jgi:penicillin-binding protein activator
MFAKTPLLPLLGAALALLAGCSTPVKRSDPTDPSTQTFRLGQADVNELVKSMVDSMLASGNVARVTGGERPVIVVIPVRLDAASLTDTRINTDALTTLVREQVLNSGLFRFVDATRRGDIAGEVAYQQESGMVDPARMAQRARQLGANFILEGTLSGFDDRTSKTRKVGYVVSMSLQNIETAEVVWQKTDQIAKEQTKGLFGW